MKQVDLSRPTQINNDSLSEELPVKINTSITPFISDYSDEAERLLQDTLEYSINDSKSTVRSMKSRLRVFLMALVYDSNINRYVLTGIIGAIPQYGSIGWELHPLAVAKRYQRYGIGTALVKALEEEILIRGGLTIYLGSDDETGTTSLYNEDLFIDTFDKLKNITNINMHPYTFYEKLGYRIVGVLPDVNGVGKHDILMAKRISRQ